MTSDLDDKVGYGSPPKHRRFKKGQSGNPRGRPRGTSNHKSIARRVAAEVHELRVGDELVELPTFALVLRAIRNEMLRGNARALKLYQTLSQKHAMAEKEAQGGFLVVPGRTTDEQWQQMTADPNPNLSEEA